jgi:hypothetical protein
VSLEPWLKQGDDIVDDHHTRTGNMCWANECNPVSWKRQRRYLGEAKEGAADTIKNVRPGESPLRVLLVGGPHAACADMAWGRWI